MWDSTSGKIVIAIISAIILIFVIRILSKKVNFRKPTWLSFQKQVANDIANQQQSVPVELPYIPPSGPDF